MLRKPIAYLVLILVSLFVLDSIAEARRGSGGSVSVKGYYRKDGTYVAPHMRSAPDGNPYNNWSYPGNTNPYTGKVAPGNPETYLENYYNRNGSRGVKSSDSVLSPNPQISAPPASTLSTPVHSLPYFQPLPESKSMGGSDLQKLFGTKQHPAIKPRSGSLSDVF